MSGSAGVMIISSSPKIVLVSALLRCLRGTLLVGKLEYAMSVERDRVQDTRQATTVEVRHG